MRERSSRKGIIGTGKTNIQARGLVASSQVSTPLEPLSTYISKALDMPLPAPVQQRAKIHLLDAVSAMVSGSRLLAGKCAIRYVRTLGGTREAHVVGTRVATTAINAALANGILGHADETDDVHSSSMFHP